MSDPASQLRFLEAQNARLKREEFERRQQVALLKRALALVQRDWKVRMPDGLDLKLSPEEEEAYEALSPSWTDRSRFFQQMERQVVQVAVELYAKERKPIHQDEVSRVWELRYSSIARRMKDPSGTVKARIRDLRRKGYFYSAPDVPEGYVMPTAKAFGPC